MTDLEEVPQSCASLTDPFDVTGPCRQEGKYLHLGVYWCAEHLLRIKEAELRAMATSWRRAQPEPAATAKSNDRTHD